MSEPRQRHAVKMKQNKYDSLGYFRQLFDAGCFPIEFQGQSGRAATSAEMRNENEKKPLVTPSPVATFTAPQSFGLMQESLPPEASQRFLNGSDDIWVIRCHLRAEPGDLARGCHQKLFEIPHHPARYPVDVFGGRQVLVEGVS